jgi:hypothetical protein
LGAYPSAASTKRHSAFTSAQLTLLASSTELLDSDGSVLLDDEHAAALRDRLDDLACETENGGLVRRAVADDERTTAIGE